jgi:hypothetical protein
MIPADKNFYLPPLLEAHFDCSGGPSDNARVTRPHVRTSGAHRNCHVHGSDAGTGNENDAGRQIGSSPVLNLHFDCSGG